MVVITGASGQLGQLVIAELLKLIPANQIVAVVRNAAKAASLAAQGVVVRIADYDKPDSLASAFADATRLLLISSSEVGKRTAQHQNVIDAAKVQGVDLIAYTSILHAFDSSLTLAQEHVATEKALAASGLPCAILRNSWYSENYTGNLAMEIEHGAILGCAGNGRISAASRLDFAAAAAAVLTQPDQAGKVYELAGDKAFTMAEFAACLSDFIGEPVAYVNVPEAEYVKVLTKAGLPEPLAQILANASTGVAKGDLFDDSGQLSALIGRPTTPIDDTIAAALDMPTWTS